MLQALGPDLSTEVSWSATDAPELDGEIASIFAATENVHKPLEYLPVYESAMSPFRSRPVRMLEIGVARGGSLQLWRRYLHPESVIVGVDIDPNARRFDDPSRQVHVRIGGQQDMLFLENVVSEFGPFDVILDDGSHMTSHMVQTFQYLFPNGLASGGIYIAEDIGANYFTGYRDNRMSFVDFTKWVIDAMHAHGLVTQGEQDFRAGGSQRLKELSVPLATTIIEKVEFHANIAVFYRAEGVLPFPCSVSQ
jgi:hypothetical protein